MKTLVAILMVSVLLALGVTSSLFYLVVKQEAAISRLQLDVIHLEQRASVTDDKLAKQDSALRSQHRYIVKLDSGEQQIADFLTRLVKALTEASSDGTKTDKSSSYSNGYPKS